MASRSSAMSCSRELLVRSLEDALAEHEEDQLAEHLSGCDSCQTELERIAAEQGTWTKVGTVLREAESDLCSNEVSSPGESAYELPNEDTLADFAVDFLAPAATADSIGRLDGIDILEVIGRGGMGVVLKGFEEELNRPVVVKMLAPHMASSGAARKRFAREAQAAAVIVHPNVMPILTVNSTGRLPYLVMPFMACESLQQRIDREGPLETLDVLRISHQVACGLAAAHAQGLVHRDVKPANILLERGVDRVLLTDFGLARAADDASLTRTGVIAGTPQFMSPEQARGDAVDARSDLFCLGSVMYALCAGRPPFRAETSYGVLRRITDEAPRPLLELNPNISPWLAGIISRLHSKDRDSRFGSADELAELLEQCIAHLQQPDAVPVPEVARQLAASCHAASSHARRKRWIGNCLSFFGIALCLFVIVSQGTRDWGGDSVPSQNAAVGASPAADPSESAETRTNTNTVESELDAWDAGISNSISELGEAVHDLDSRSQQFWDVRAVPQKPQTRPDTEVPSEYPSSNQETLQ